MTIEERSLPTTDGAALTVLLMSASAAESHAALTESVVALFVRLRALLDGEAAPDVVRVVLVVEERGDAPVEARPLRAACAEAARGVAQGIAREIGPRVRINVIRCDDAVDDLLAPTFTFLASTEANFVTGSTFDLRRAA